MTSKPDDVLRRTGQVYDSAAEEYVRAFFEDEADVPWLERIAEVTPPGTAILDVGCGPGNFARYFVAWGYQVFGVDLASRMLQVGRRMVPGMRSAVMDMRTLCFRDESFTTLLVAYSLLHVPGNEVPAALDRFHTILKRGGVLALMLKVGEGERVVPASLVPGELCFVQFWTPESMTQLLNRSRFEVEEVQSALPSTPEELQFEKLFLLARAV